MKERHLLLFIACVAVALGQTPGSVDIQIGILDGVPSPRQYGQVLESRFAQGGMTVLHSVTRLSVAYPPSSTSTVSTTALPNSETTAVQDEISFARALIPSWISMAILALFTSLLSPRKLNVLFVFGVVSLCTFQSFAHAMAVYENCKLLNNEVDYRLYWNVSSPYIYFAAKANTVGWLAFGLSLNGQMNSGGTAPGSDIMLGYMNAQDPNCQNGCINDYSTRVYDKPILDQKQDLELLSYEEANGVTTIEWRRLLNTGDASTDQIINPNSAHHVIWALHPNDKPTNANTFAKHLANTRGSDRIVFSERSTCPVPTTMVTVNMTLEVDPAKFDREAFLDALADHLQIDENRLVILSVIEHQPIVCPTCRILEFTYPNYSVPTADTTYVCYGFDFPTDTTYHVIRFEPVKDNLQVLHHMVLYKSDTRYPAGFHSCVMAPSAMPMWAWAPGGDVLDVPVQAGFPVGAGGQGAYGILQMHYSNPSRSPNFRDSSGVKLYLTTQLRPSHAGFLFLGIDTGRILIPRNREAWHLSASCPSATTNALGSTVLNVFASFLHMHLHGRQIWTEHKRNGVSLPNMGTDHAFDFNAQQFLPVNSTIRAGDELITHCVWDSRNSTTDVRGGEETEDEMCLNMILYYPAIPVAACTTQPTAGCNYGTPGCP